MLIKTEIPSPIPGFFKDCSQNSRTIAIYPKPKFHWYLSFQKIKCWMILHFLFAPHFETDGQKELSCLLIQICRLVTVGNLQSFRLILQSQKIISFSNYLFPMHEIISQGFLGTNRKLKSFPGFFHQNKNLSTFPPFLEFWDQLGTLSILIIMSAKICCDFNSVVYI